LKNRTLVRWVQLLINKSVACVIREFKNQNHKPKRGLKGLFCLVLVIANRFFAAAKRMFSTAKKLFSIAKRLFSTAKKLFATAKRLFAKAKMLSAKAKRLSAKAKMLFEAAGNLTIALKSLNY
jgi:hypothetical protein